MTGLRPRAERLPFLRRVVEGPLLTLIGAPARCKGDTVCYPRHRRPGIRVAVAALGRRASVIPVDRFTPATAYAPDGIVLGVRDGKVVTVSELRPLHPDEKTVLEDNFRLVRRAIHWALTKLHYRHRVYRRYVSHFHSAAHAAAIRAVMLYDETRGTQFSTYLYRVVLHGMLSEHLIVRRWLEQLWDARALDHLPAPWGDPATDPAVAARLDPEGDREAVERFVGRYAPGLTPRELAIFVGHAGLYGERLPFTHYARRYGISKERVRQIYVQVTSTLRNAVSTYHPDYRD